MIVDWSLINEAHKMVRIRVRVMIRNHTLQGNVNEVALDGEKQVCHLIFRSLYDAFVRPTCPFDTFVPLLCLDDNLGACNSGLHRSQSE